MVDRKRIGFVLKLIAMLCSLDLVNRVAIRAFYRNEWLLSLRASVKVTPREV